VDLYSAFIEIPHIQGAQVQITQCYLQITSYLPLPRKDSPDGASPDWGCGHLIAAYYSFIYPERMKGWVGLVAGYIMRHFTCPKAVTHPSTNRARCRATALIETNALPLHHTANPMLNRSFWHEWHLRCSHNERQLRRWAWVRSRRNTSRWWWPMHSWTTTSRNCSTKWTYSRTDWQTLKNTQYSLNFNWLTPREYDVILLSVLLEFDSLMMLVWH